MSEKAIEVIAEAFRDAEVDCTWTPEGHATHVLAALKAARIAVVELPDENVKWREGADEGYAGSWDVSDDEYVSAWPGEVVDAAGRTFDIHGARAFAAALLAAADAAEAVSHE